MPWQLGDTEWVTSVLWLARPGAAHAVRLFWQPDPAWPIPEMPDGWDMD